MAKPDELRAKARELYDQADKIDNPDERLPVVLRALECEMEADALEREDETLALAYVIGGQAGGRARPR